MTPDTTDLLLALMRFYGDCLMAYPELLESAELTAIEAAMREPVNPEQDAADNPAFRLMFFLSEYKDADLLPSYPALYDAHEALLAVVERGAL